MEESALDTAIDVGKTVYGGMRRLASRVVTAWQKAGETPTDVGTPERKPSIPAPVSAGFAGPAAAPALKPAPKPERSDTLYPTQGEKLHSTEAGMDPEFRKNLIKAKGESPSGGANLMGPRSGFRTVQQQVDIAKTARPGMAAKPGGSMHGKGIAADLKYNSPAEREWYHEKAGIKAGFHFPLQGQAPGIPNEPWHAEKPGSRKASWKGFVPVPTRKPANEEKKMEKLDEIKAPWEGIDKAAADTARWRKNREEGKRAVSDAKTEKRPGWLKKTVGDYISAKYGVKKEENLGEIAPAIEVVGWRKQFQDKDKAKAEAKKEAKKKALGFNRAKPGEHGWGFEVDKAGKKRQLSKKETMGEGKTIKWSDEARKKHEADNARRAKEQEGKSEQEQKDKAFEYHYSHPIKKKAMKEDKTQTSPGVETEEHPKKIELPEKYEGAYSVRNIYMEGSGSFYGGAGQGGGLGVAGPGAAPVRRLAPRPQARPQAAAPPAAKPAAAPVTPVAAAGPTQTPTPGPTLKAKPDIMATTVPDPRSTPSGEPTKPSRVAGGTPVVAGPATSTTAPTVQVAAPAPKPAPVAPTAAPAPPAIPAPERAAQAPQVAGFDGGQQRQGPLAGLIKKKIGELGGGGGGGFKNILGGFLNR